MSAAEPMPPPGPAELRLGLLLTMAPGRLEAVLAGSPEAALPWVRAAAEAGLPQAQLRYGRMLLQGEGALRDPCAAAAWFRRAAEAGEAEARNMLGRCHENGWGLAQDLEAAARWYALAAEDGCAWAQYNLAHLFLNGLGVRRDPAQAYGWYLKAALQGHARAMNLVSRCLEEGWGAPRDLLAARDWRRRSAEAGYFRGQYNHATGLAEEGRLEEARGLFEAALAGAPPATRRTMAQALAARPEPPLRALGETVLEAAA